MKIYKYWLVNCFCFVALFFLFSSAINYFFLIKPVYNPDNYKLDHDIDTIIIGASHSACAFDSNKIENSAIVARSGEPIFFTYYKLKNLLDQNKGIKKAIWTLSENSISKFQDRRVFMGLDGSKDLFFNYFSLLNESGKRYFNWYSVDYFQANLKYSFGVPLSYNRDLKVFIKYYLKRLGYFDFPFSGGSEGNNAEVHLEDHLITDKIKKYFYDNNKNFDCSTVAIEHIDKIIQLCKDKSVKLFIVKTPLHKKYIDKIPQYYRTEYIRLIDKIKLKHPEIYYANYMDIALPDKFYLDGDHVNKHGKAYFSEIIINSILANETIGEK